MATYKHGDYLIHDNGAQFDAIHAPGTITEWSGVYRCTHCGRTIVSVHGRPMPPQNHHEHPASAGRILWQLLVATSFR